MRARSDARVNWGTKLAIIFNFVVYIYTYKTNAFGGLRKNEIVLCLYQTIYTNTFDWKYAFHGVHYSTHWVLLRTRYQCYFLVLMGDEIQFQIMMPEASSQSLTVDTPAGGIQWVFIYYLQRGSIVFGYSKQSNSIHRDFVCTTLTKIPINHIILTQLQGRTFYRNPFSPAD